MQSSQWRRWGRAWSRSESGWWPKWRSRWRRKSNKLWMRPKRNSGAPTAGKRPSSTAAGTRVTAITPVSKPTGQSTWSPAHSPVTETPNCRWTWLGCLPKQVKLRCSYMSFLNQFCKQLQHPFSYFRLCFSDSHSFTAGDRNGAQLGPFGQTIEPLSWYTAPSGRVHIRQKQLSLICGKKQRQRWSYCDLTATLQILLKDLGLVPRTRVARPCLCATNHLLFLTPHIYFVYILFLVHGFLSSVFRWCHHVKVVLRNKMWLYHDVVLLKNVFSHLRKIVSSLLEVCDVVFQCCSEVASWLFFCFRFFSTFRDTSL